MISRPQTFTTQKYPSRGENLEQINLFLLILCFFSFDDFFNNYKEIYP